MSENRGLLSVGFPSAIRMSTKTVRNWTIYGAVLLFGALAQTEATAAVRIETLLDDCLALAITGEEGALASHRLPLADGDTQTDRRLGVVQTDLGAVSVSYAITSRPGCAVFGVNPDFPTVDVAWARARDRILTWSEATSSRSDWLGIEHQGDRFIVSFCKDGFATIHFGAGPASQRFTQVLPRPESELKGKVGRLALWVMDLGNNPPPFTCDVARERIAAKG